jgi:hypothetical protein
MEPETEQDRYIIGRMWRYCMPDGATGFVNFLVAWRNLPLHTLRGSLDAAVRTAGPNNDNEAARVLYVMIRDNPYI